MYYIEKRSWRVCLCFGIAGMVGSYSGLSPFVPGGLKQNGFSIVERGGIGGFNNQGIRWGGLQQHLNVVD